jgi:hypothetical protein
MPNAERNKKRKANLLSESAVKCQKLSDLFSFQDSLHPVSVIISIAIQNPEATNQLNTICKSSINENDIITPDKKINKPQNLVTYANKPEVQPSGSSSTLSNTTVAEHVATRPSCELSDHVTETATTCLPTCEPSVKKLK